jgi:hypothetical protein
MWKAQGIWALQFSAVKNTAKVKDNRIILNPEILHQESEP